MDYSTPGPSSPSKLPSSPSKGKTTETGAKNWRAGWWDFYPLLERPKRPLQWSQSSIIFTAHPTQPSITGRHFSSSKQFVLPSPSAIASNTSSYNPPSLISVSPGDQYLLAYFPKNDGEGMACIWKRGFEIDNWQVKESWPLPKGGGIIAASWIGAHREWSTGCSGVPTRLPMRGPVMHISDPTVLLVTEDNHVQVVYVRQYLPGLKTLKRSLLISGITKEAQPNPYDIVEQMGITRQCTDAAIGLAYNENTILVATHGRRLPPPPSGTPAPAVSTFNSMDLSVNVDISGLPTHEKGVAEWENWGEERTLELYEVQIRFDGALLSLFVNHISTLDSPSPCVANLTFVSAPTASPPQSEASQTQTQPKPAATDRGKVSLLANFMDLHNYTKPPTSTLAVYQLVPVVKPFHSNPTTKITIWTVQNPVTRIINDGVVTFVEPFIDYSGVDTTLLYTCILGTSGAFKEPKSSHNGKGTPIGTLRVLNSSNLSDNMSWQSAVIRSSSDVVGRDLPLFAVLSPNKKLFCTLSFSLWQPSMAIYTVPTLDDGDAHARTALELATAVLGRSSTLDIVHAISMASVSTSTVTDVLYRTLEILDKYHQGELPDRFIWDILGVAVEVYRTKMNASKAKKGPDAENLECRWQTAHDICSIAACNIAFDGCSEKIGYDLDAVWQLIGICTWIVSFTEKLLKACVLSGSAGTGQHSDTTDPDPLLHPTLLHLAHPYALQNLLAALNHVKTFRDYTGSLPAGSENSQLAQRSLLDCVDFSCFNLAELISILERSYVSLKETPTEDFRRSLAACQPTNTTRSHLTELLQNISRSETLINKSALFIKPSDLMDGLTQLPGHTSKKADEKDVVSKAPISMKGPTDLCIRCGGKTVTSQNAYTTSANFLSKWRVFETMWQLRCVCGGRWSLSVPPAVKH
ncbi:hypothetical protein D9613_003116 [Agrocybe pediades]|uniref:Mediator complex subunit 16 n=1 Tax=Agrocybe pediades TaxID=84607 RepID=A0A8H4VNY5_9AGAR|nr:hypothetical protein D9613_003116 [Agrocybe pediades]